jgi:hypothetical protein
MSCKKGHNVVSEASQSSLGHDAPLTFWGIDVNRIKHLVGLGVSRSNKRRRGGQQPAGQSAADDKFNK